MRLIVTAMKNEGPFILEWAAHHLAIGFDRFLVYTNDCDDGTDAIWRRLEEIGLAAHVANDDIRARGVQKTALMRADGHPLTAGAEWLACLDVDEFIGVKTGAGALDDLFESAGAADMIALAWRRFGAYGVARFADAPVLERLTRAAPEICPFPFHYYGVKSLWRRDAGWARIGVHRPLDLAEGAAPRVVNAKGAPLPRYRENGLWLRPESAGYGAAQVNHYALRSAEDYLAKCDRGLPNSRLTRLDLGYWAERNFNQVEDRSIACSAAIRAETLAELRADAELARLHDAACDRRRRRIARLLEDPAHLKLYLAIVATETAALSPDEAARLNPLVARSWEAERSARRRREP